MCSSKCNLAIQISDFFSLPKLSLKSRSITIPKSLDPSRKMDLDFRDSFGRHTASITINKYNIYLPLSCIPLFLGKKYGEISKTYHRIIFRT